MKLFSETLTRALPIKGLTIRDAIPRVPIRTPIWTSVEPIPKK
jgi:hypothetical protein